MMSVNKHVFYRNRFVSHLTDPDSGGAFPAAAGTAERDGLHQQRGQPAGAHRHGRRHQRRHRKTARLAAILIPAPPNHNQRQVTVTNTVPVIT